MPEPARSDPFANPTKKCDIVMKGGITSGIVYPSAVCKLAEVYRFVNVGGTSAGAIAAVATAAAEYRRAKGSSHGFEVLSRLPASLAAEQGPGKHTTLFQLFQPDPDVRLLFDVALSFTKTKWLLALLGSLIKGAPLVWIAVALLGVLFAFLPQLSTTRDSIFGVLSAILWVVFLLVAGLALVIGSKLRKLPERGYGLCSGMSTSTSGPPALAGWFDSLLSDISGKPADQPLTFGDLQSNGVQLRMMTTCATHGRPYGLPIDTNDFYFKESEFLEYFPKPVVNWMVKHSGSASVPGTDDPVDDSGFCRLPRPADMPVLVAARMSLSFPVLFRAVPLYKVDYSLRRVKPGEPAVSPTPGGAINANEPRRPERCWFLDGGICSNFPIFMFDAPLPRWPTFGIDLQSLRPDRPDSFVWMPSDNKEGFGELWNRFGTSGGLSALVQYATALIDSARNWNDNRQMTVPGYRDRIVHIQLDDSKQGGLMLDMPQDVVATVSGQGTEAARLLLEHFFNPTPDVTLTWDNHRWIRFRSLMGRFEEIVQQFQRGFTAPEPGERSYTELLERSDKEPPNSYRLTGNQRDFLEHWVPLLLRVADEVSKPDVHERPTAGEPRPTPVIRALPRTIPPADADRPAAPVIDPQMEGERSVHPGTT